MIHTIRTSKFSKLIASYLAIQLVLTTVQPTNLYALTGGPSQPEFNSFTPIGTSDMVNLSSGDFTYNIPIMDVGGYPLNLSYASGITMDQEASWVGLGWNLNIGQINRQVRGLPDDFKGDEMIYENKLKPNRTIGGHVSFHPAFWGLDIPVSVGVGLGVDHNNYSGWSYSSTAGVALKMNDNTTIGVDLTSSSDNGVSITPKVSLNKLKFGSKKFNLGSTLGATYNSRQGLTSLSISPSLYKEDKRIGVGGKINGGSTHTKSFLTTSYTPSKRNKMVNQNIKGNAAFGAEIFGIEGQLELYAYASIQSLALEERRKTEKAYGFNFTEHASDHDILDFNRQNDRIINKHTAVLPITNYTYDLYSINGQGVSGMYQPQRSQVGYVYDRYVKDISRDGNIGYEVGVVNIAHGNVEFAYSPSNSSTGVWNGYSNQARSNFVQSTNNSPEYEKVFYKSVGELNVDHDNLLWSHLGGESPIRIGLTGANSSKRTVANKYYSGNQELTTAVNFPSTGKINRQQRLIRNKSIQSLSRVEADILYENYEDDDFKPKIHPGAKGHHNTATRITQPDGSTYIFGQPAYNSLKQEVTFNASGNSNYSPNDEYGNYLVKYSAGSDNSAGNIFNSNSGNSKGTDNYFNRTTTPEYAHTYLLTEVLSSDYEDIYLDGPTDDDLGNYTKFYYEDYNTSGTNENPTTYKWRVPFEENAATSNKGLYTLQGDDMGNYIYGEKELFYVNKIETKTHIAILDLKKRDDARGVKGENGGRSDESVMYHINKIYLFSKPEYVKLTENTDFDLIPEDIRSKSAIKVAHFEYGYTLCKNLPNNINYNPDDAYNADGKLTLEKVFFTYRGSNMGKYTPYTFDYDEDNSDSNPDYHIKGSDLWGNYKNPLGKGHNYNDEPTTSEFPYIDQNNQEEANKNATAWTLRSIDLPSGGKIQLEYEADDYSNVQDEKAMQMFKVRGAGSSLTPSSPYSNKLYQNNNYKKYLYVELGDDTDPELVTDTEEPISVATFREKFLTGIIDKPIYFRFLLNMVRGDNKTYDFVEGYFKIDNGLEANERFNVFESNNKIFAAMPVSYTHLNKSYMSSNGVHPISKAGWYFGRQYLNSVVYGGDEYAQQLDVLDVAWNIVNKIGQMYALFVGPNTELRNNGCAQIFSNTKSWIRLQSPKDKVGGGLKVTKVEMFDQWDTMVSSSTEENEHLYKMSYGQEYSYANTDGRSSGVAAFEPFGGKENPFIVPIHDGVNDDKFLAPEEQGYTEKPFGVSFFPSAKVTYGRVTVKNLNRGTYNNNGTSFQVGNNGTGKIVNEFFTTKNYPTIAKYTTLDGPHPVDFPPGGVSIIASILGINVYTEKAISLSQGFLIITNDMDGKEKSQQVFRESNPNSPVSKVEYFYDIDSQGNLDNKLNTINDKGEVEENIIGVDYNVVNDFRNSKSSTQSYGADINLGGTIYGLFPFLSASVTPLISVHTTELKMAVTTKVIHKTGIMVEKKAKDLGAEVTTKNLAWDAETGQVILTQTDNEYKNDTYYNFNYPAYWYYKAMSSASNNLGISLALSSSNNNQYSVNNASDYLINGDEVLAKHGDSTTRCWVTQLDGNSFSLIDFEGHYFNDAEKIKVIKSGFKNLQTASMASITLMKNPIDTNDDGSLNNLNQESFIASTWDNQRIINASAIRYSDTWPAPCECNLPKMIYNDQSELEFVHEPGDDNAYNPYLYNIKNEWRANESFAFLTGRYNDDENDNSTDPDSNLGYNPRKAGFFMSFDPFYKLTSAGGSWYIEPTIDTPQRKWTFASQVSLYNPYGVELENKDALDRYSSAQYGYNYKFPVAVASNGQYREIGFDGFEDNTSDCDNEHFKIKSSGNTSSQISGLNSHSGRNSLKVNPNNAAVLEIRIKECPEDPNSTGNPNSGEGE